MQRPAIPAEIKRAVLVEAGHRCAIPRCGETELDIHHIVPWETCQKHEYSNLIALCPVCHRRAHKGEIDRKALLQYKAALIATDSPGLQGNFDAPIVEIRRRISEFNLDVPGYRFEFDFPDFQEPVRRVVSKNLEAWGNELLAQFKENQESYVPFETEGDAEIDSFFTTPSQLKGTYQVVRNDEAVISVEYVLDRYFTGAAHSGKHTRVQNFLIKPFQPVTLTELMGETSSIEDLSSLIREILLDSGQYDEEWVLRGTEPKERNFSRFVLEERGVRFTFEEYQIDCYASGRQKLWISYDQMKGVGNASLIEKINKHDFY
ncbi:HNH endonuclease [Pontibacterium sp.]|uniref:HNH endonuclease n=1 Tax=Pontibacterium sp. TaxID=2036026 RepID=UPI003511A698